MLGDEVSGTKIGDPSLASVRNKAFGAMRSHLQTHSPDRYAEFQQIASDKERREWLAEYLVDPTCGSCVGKNWTQRTTNRSSLEDEEWLLKTQLAGPSY
jgi:hypothetical protein